MPYCINNPKRTYKGNEPSPKGLGYCASGEEEGTTMKGKDDNLWIKKGGKWVIDNEKLLYDKLYKWWLSLSQGGIIVIFKDGKHKLITSSMKSHKAKSKDILKKWNEFNENNNVKVIIWSAQSVDILQSFVDFLSKKKDIMKQTNLPNYLLDNYKKFFVKYEFIGNKDYTFKP